VSVEALVSRLGLVPHPEGGYYKETYRSAESIPGRGRSVCTAIHYLLPAGAFSALHRIKSDELWFFHAGGPLVVAELAADGTVEETVLGVDLAAGQAPQHAVPAGRWFGAYPAPGTAFALVSCAVAPGFDFADFELGRRDELLAAYPQARALIERLTR
jgi:predicted cupin superfamily sugar epimerase